MPMLPYDQRDPSDPRWVESAAEQITEQEREWDRLDAEDYERCSDPRGHSFYRTGTAFGGDDERWMGEGRCFCRYCGADGDA